MIDQRVVIITGGAGGIGRKVAKKFTDMGDAVALIDMNQEVGEATAKAFRDAGKTASFYKVDITDDQACEKAVQDIVKEYGRIDVLYNNAGVLGKTNNFLKMDMSEFRKVMDINLCAAVQMTKLVANEIIKAGRTGVVINTSSLAGFLPNHEPICYPVSKAAISMLTQATARELGGKGIRVVAVAPGWVRTIVTGGSVANPFDRPDIKELHMDGRVVEPEEVAEVVYFLSTPASSGINGTTVMVDLGYCGFKLQTSLYKE